jgi:phenol 2-monooxygenase
LVGDALNQAWGVMDILAVTDFPDIRLKAAIQSINEGNVLIIPREGGYMVRMYIELDKLKEDERVDRENMTVDVLINAANRIMSPYTLDVKEVPWWSVYEIGQRLTTAFDDSKDGQSPRVFLAGDACHTHSPKAGQGLNTSVMDTWNLGWKLAHVLTGRAPKELLSTYSAERADIAKQLIDFDREWSKMFSSKPKTEDNPNGVDPAEFQKYFELFARFTAGVGIQYKPSAIVGDNTYQGLASGQPIGQRFHSAPVIRHGDAKPVQLGHCHTANGAWRIYAFAGFDDPASDSCRMRKLADFLANDPASPILKHTPTGADCDSVIDFRAVYQTPHRELERGDLHPFMTPAKGSLGLRDYEKVFCLDHGSQKNIYEMRGISMSEGCVVIVRPDQYVAAVLPLDQHRELCEFFSRCLL